MPQAEKIIMRFLRSLHSSAALMSNIGKQPIRLVEGVSCITEEVPVEFSRAFFKGKKVFNLNQQIFVRGPLGQLKFSVPSFVKLSIDNSTVTVSVEDPEDKVQRSMWGTTRALLQNHIIGISEGHLAIVKLVGTGFRANIESNDKGDQFVTLKVGFPYLPRLKVPEGIKVSSPNPARLLIEGTDKQQVKLFAARIREFKKPEPYKGKGIFVDDETIRLKEKKIK